ENRFNAYGVFASARVLENGAAEADFQRPAMTRVLQPVAGRERFRLVSTLPPQEIANLRDLQNHGYQSAVRRTDVIKGLVRTITFDNAHFGRKASEFFLDGFDGTRSFAVTVAPEYRDDFFFGLVPVKTSTRSAAGALHSEIT